ncbi:peptidylprolyl isomerase [Candidatus Viadribacter manganicus]|uniref:peptidylprolyl isomerase n=1 Tax=Candidatus Viadribacter manganicus TaxID=1759059 RepID=A0A1B1AMJ1_9PROT|nr:peptidylprolyl isomerase [Candidatus Viadribacter manganicus]ANP47774.1 hypothetical protein ATE48_18665 [Candidatus Viadribacter manganicus]
MNAEADVRVRLSTPAGDILLDILASKAPRAARAFLAHIDAGRLDGVPFARAVRRDNDNGQPSIEVLQTWPLPGDIEILTGRFESTAESGLRHIEGAVSFARSADGVTPSAFFICLSEEPALDHGGARQDDRQGFPVFAAVVEGLDVVRDIHARETSPEAPIAYLKGQMLVAPVPIVSARRSPPRIGRT